MRLQPYVLFTLSVPVALLLGAYACSNGTFPNALSVYDPDGGATTFLPDSSALDDAADGQVEAATDAGDAGDGDAATAKDGGNAGDAGEGGSAADGSAALDGGDAALDDASDLADAVTSD
jgi:hypothetical protein